MSKVRVAETEAEIRESIYISVFPKRGVRDLYVAGGDSYDIDKSVTSKSLGGMVVLARDSLCPPCRTQNVATRHYKTTPFKEGNLLGELS